MEQKESNNSREQWEVWISEQQASGLSIQKWCKEKQIPTMRYYYWKKRIHKTPEQAVRSEEITLQQETIPERFPKTENFSVPIHIQYRQYEVLISETADSSQIVTVLEALRKVC